MTDPPDVPFSRQQAHQQGFSDATLRAWTEHGAVRRVFRGVYVPADAADTLEVRTACAALVLPQHCVVVERSAAWLHGIDLHAPDEHFTVPALEVASLRDHPPVHRPGIYGGTRDLKSEDIMAIGATRVTTPLRTAMDLACLRGEQGALAALDAFMRCHQLTHEQFERTLHRYKRRRGVVQLRRLIPLASPLAESQAESWLRATLLKHGFPPPELQIEVWEAGRLKARVDLGYRHLKIAIEYFGEEFHGPLRAEHDSARITWLEERGWRVIVVRKHQLGGAPLQEVLGELTSCYAERSKPRGKRRYPRGLPLLG